MYRIEDNDGNVIYDYQQNHSEEQAISFDTATIMNKLLHLPINGTDTDAYPTANMVRRDDLDQIGKTGTTEDSNDVWYMGGTTAFVCGIWNGHEYKEEIYDTNSAKKMYNGIIDWMEANYYDFLHSGSYVLERQRGAAFLLPRQRPAPRPELRAHCKRLVFAEQHSEDV